MKQRIHAATASILIAAGSAAALPVSAEVAHPVMVVNRSAAAEDKLARSTQACVERALAGRFEDAMPFCNLAIRYSEAVSPDAAQAPSIDPAAVRSNRAVVSWMLGRDQRAAADMAIAVAQSPEASFVQKNLVAMGMEPKAATLAGGAGD